MEERTPSDIIRVHNPNKRVYNFRGNKYASCLDLLLLTDRLTEKISQLKIHEGPHSDHLLITFHLRFMQARPGQGYWRFDTGLLMDDQFNEAMHSFLSDWFPPAELTPDGSGLRWRLGTLLDDL